MGKSIFALDFPLKLFYATIAKADTGSLKPFYIHSTYLDHTLAKFEQNRMVQSVLKMIFMTKTRFLNRFHKALTPFCRMFVAETLV